jgi:hypothetical protein
VKKHTHEISPVPGKERQTLTDTRAYKSAQDFLVIFYESWSFGKQQLNLTNVNKCIYLLFPSEQYPITKGIVDMQANVGAKADIIRIEVSKAFLLHV